MNETNERSNKQNECREKGTDERSLLKLQTPQNVVEGSVSAQLFIYGKKIFAVEIFKIEI